MVTSPQKIKTTRRVKDPVTKATLKLFIKIVTFAIVIVSVFTFIFGIHRVNDTGMVPNINPGDMILYYRIDKKYLVGEPVVYQYKGDIKIARIVASSGDTVDIDENGFKVNNSHQYEDKIYKETLPFKEGIKFPVTLKEGEVFLLADNRDKATDSRLFGPVQTKDISGKIFTLIRRRDI
ncbi:signal peptidase I [Atopobacter phocae]|uniref:signal peptidase I n=1 Tax=Atopobacter phocae TaxID=136492 RepID=UPI00046FFFF3|nr:signal peptidase I [Atopobacter phocae]